MKTVCVWNNHFKFGVKGVIMFSKNRLFFLLLCISVFAISCGGSSYTREGAADNSAKTATAKNPADGSHENRTYRNESIDLGQYKAVYVENASIDTTASRDEKINDFLNQMQGRVNSSILQALQTSGRFQTVTTVEDDAKATGKYLICRSDVLVNFGSTAARLLIGMGAGKSKLIVVNSLEDPGTKEIILKYTGWGGAIMGYGFQVLAKMQTDAEIISQYFGNLVRKFPNK